VQALVVVAVHHWELLHQALVEAEEARLVRQTQAWAVVEEVVVLMEHHYLALVEVAEEHQRLLASAVALVQV
jgi:hypothetical protein